MVDIEFNHINDEQVTNFIESNKKALNALKEEFAQVLHEENLSQMKSIIARVGRSENKMVCAIADKLDQIVDAMIKLDLTDVDLETGKPLKMSTYLQLLEAMEKTSKMMEKYGGTSLVRELHLYSEKAKIDAISKQGGALIPATGRTVDNNPIGSTMGDRPNVFVPEKTS